MLGRNVQNVFADPVLWLYLSKEILMLLTTKYGLTEPELGK